MRLNFQQSKKYDKKLYDKNNLIKYWYSTKQYKKYDKQYDKYDKTFVY